MLQNSKESRSDGVSSCKRTLVKKSSKLVFLSLKCSLAKELCFNPLVPDAY